MKAKANEAKERKMKALADLAEGGGEFVIPEKDTSIKLQLRIYEFQFYDNFDALLTLT